MRIKFAGIVPSFLALLLAGCGGDSSSTVAPTTPAEDSPELALNPLCLGELLNIQSITGVEISSGFSSGISLSGSSISGFGSSLQVTGYLAPAARDAAETTDDPESAPSCPSADDVEYIYFAAAGLPEHDTGIFPNDQSPFPVIAQDRTFRVTAHPMEAESVTPLSSDRFDGVMANGVPVRMRESGCPAGVDCADWHVNPLYEPSWFGIDSHNGHTMTGGSYHYHGDPGALYDDIAPAGATVIGTAADGFPIFGPWIDDDGVIRKVNSSYALKLGQRPVNAFLNPGLVGPWTGEYVEDYEFVSGSGDLDECNGMSISGIYGYFVTEDFPYLMNCFKGTPDPSFDITP